MVSNGYMKHPSSGRQGLIPVKKFSLNFKNDIISIMIVFEGEIRPKEISQTVSVGEPVTFTVEKNNGISNLRWRHNGGESIPALDGWDTNTISSVTVQDAGVYECYQNGKRDRGLHAIFQLVVRGEQRNLDPI